MKTRSGFVSNSSSSSFVVIGHFVDPKDIRALAQLHGHTDRLFVTPELGCHQFGWENTKYTHFWDKVMFAWIQAEYVKEKHPEWFGMLNKVLCEQLDVKAVCWNLSTEWTSVSGDSCYIDHQSASHEGCNTEIFDSEEDLICFLFSRQSYIQGGSDNE